MKKELDFWNGTPNSGSIGFSLFPILIYSKQKQFSTIYYRFEIGIFFWSMRLKWETIIK